MELLPTTAIYGNLLTTGLYIGEVADYPLKAVVFVSKNLKALVEIVGEMCSYLHDNGTAFSLLISDCGTRIFLFPQVIIGLIRANTLKLMNCPNKCIVNMRNYQYKVTYVALFTESKTLKCCRCKKFIGYFGFTFRLTIAFLLFLVGALYIYIIFLETGLYTFGIPSFYLGMWWLLCV